ncbi:MAG: hypothetical protein DSY80_00170 [Desulfocapsa sp.]|nr:MAG: hypothetical protein DSY80_00170 [Desulfocapsa sp.]
MAKKALDELMAQKKFTNITLEQVEIITNPLRALKDGIKLIPALKYGEEKLSGIFLSKEKIATFFNKAGKLEDTGL